jgi:predicted O-methyltransferase YrrM
MSSTNFNIKTGMIFFRVAKYLKYILTSKNSIGHGIHSPFVFDLVSRVFRNNIDQVIVDRIEMVRKRLIADKKIISVKDLGSGLDGRDTTLSRISDIVRYSAVPGKYGMLLANLAVEFGKPLIVEFGTSFGISTLYMALFCQETLIFTMEGSQAIADIAENNFEESGVNNVKLFIGPFEEILPEITKQGIKPGLVFIDGNHRKQPVLSYFKELVEISGNETVVVIDDIYYSREMEEAWNEIKKHEKVSITVDIFRMGMVFFKNCVTHNDYIIRY